MPASKGEQILRDFCQSQNVKFDDVDNILELCGSDKTEVEIETELQKYPQRAIDIAGKAFRGILS